MSLKHKALWFLLGWAVVGYLLPPQRVVAYFRKSG